MAIERKIKEIDMAIERKIKEIDPLWYLLVLGGLTTVVVATKLPALWDTLQEFQGAKITPLDSESVGETLRCHKEVRQIPLGDNEWITINSPIICEPKTGR